MFTCVYVRMYECECECMCVCILYVCVNVSVCMAIMNDVHFLHNTDRTATHM